MLLLLSCGRDSDVPIAPDLHSDTSVALKLTIPARLQQSIARVEYVVAAADMDTLRGELAIAGNVAHGTITGIEPGSARLFVLNAYDAAGELSHSGSATATIKAGGTAEVRIQLLPLTGGADVVGDFGEAPLFPKARELIGTWRLNLGTADDLEFSYSFETDGQFTNRIGGAFLSALRDLDELESLDLGQLDQFDGGTLILSGTWTPGADSLHLEFAELQIELWGELPLIGRVDVGILREDLGDGAEFDLDFACAVSADELRLRGPALTLGVPLGAEQAGEAAADEFAEVSGMGRAGLAQIASAIGAAIGSRNLSEVVLVRVE